MLTLTKAQIAEIKRRILPDVPLNKHVNRFVMCSVQNNQCFWCGQPMLRRISKRRNPVPPLAATIEHLDARLDAAIIKALDGLKMVAAHNVCNHARSTEQGRITEKR